MYTLSATYGEEIQHDPVEPLDQFDVAEFVPIAYRVNFSAQWVRVIRNSIKLRDGVEIFPRLEEILNAADMTATIEDRQTGAAITNIQRVKATRYNINIGARAIVLTDVEFVAVRIRDESEVA
jgi:hypothetical protein